jgi:ABC-type lipoprotein export system ATPase subunit
MDNARGVRSVIGNGTALARADEMQAISKEIALHSVVVIAGESGSGKSALVSRLVAPDAQLRVGSFLRNDWAGCTIVTIERPGPDRRSAGPSYLRIFTIFSGFD